MTFNLRFKPGDIVYLVQEGCNAIEPVEIERVTLKYVDFLKGGEQLNYDWRNDNPYLRYRVSHHLGLKKGREWLYFRDSGLDELEVRSLKEGYHIFIDEASAKKFLRK